MTIPISASAPETGFAGNTRAAQRALRRFNTGLGIFVAGVAAIAATDAGLVWMLQRLREVVDQYGWGNVPPEDVPPFEILDQWGTPIDLGAIALYGIGFFMAMLNARRLAEAIGIRGWTHGWGWTVGTILIPIACLFRPWLGLAEIRRAIVDSAAAGRATRSEEFSAFTLILGVSFFVCNGIVRISAFEIENLATPSSAFSFYQFIDREISLLLTIAATQAVMLGIMLAYLLTIRGRMVRLADLIDLDAFD
jgi:hypothetical protein